MIPEKCYTIQISKDELDKLKKDLADALQRIQELNGMILGGFDESKTPAEIEYADLIPEKTAEERGVAADLASTLRPGEIPG